MRLAARLACSEYTGKDEGERMKSKFRPVERAVLIALLVLTLMSAFLCVGVRSPFVRDVPLEEKIKLQAILSAPGMIFAGTLMLYVYAIARPLNIPRSMRAAQIAYFVVATILILLGIAALIYQL